VFLNLHSEVLKYIIIKLDDKPSPHEEEDVIEETPKDKEIKEEEN
jgi:hypothetical protein